MIFTMQQKLKDRCGRTISVSQINLAKPIEKPMGRIFPTRYDTSTWSVIREWFNQFSYDNADGRCFRYRNNPAKTKMLALDLLLGDA